MVMVLDIKFGFYTPFPQNFSDFLQICFAVLTAIAIRANHQNEVKDDV